MPILFCPAAEAFPGYFCFLHSIPRFCADPCFQKIKPDKSVGTAQVQTYVAEAA